MLPDTELKEKNLGAEWLLGGAVGASNAPGARQAAEPSRGGPAHSRPQAANWFWANTGI